ncbi:hypothetical protein Tco_0954341 [Tanacetum coccineum]|uniref:Uncharacterized protein n=1 Tax=Tanacetum coccineum TaxID=301880 RepID=A0ABQ5E2I0_9ASTR
MSPRINPPRGMEPEHLSDTKVLAMKMEILTRANIKQALGRSVLTDPEDQAKMEMETPRSSRVNSSPNASTKNASNRDIMQLNVHTHFQQL